MGLTVSRTTEPLRFDTGIGNAEFAEIASSPVDGQSQKPLMPGVTTVTRAVDALFPTGENVSAETLAALVASSPAALRTSSGFGRAARDAASALRRRGTEAAGRAAAELETLLADAELFERCRLALLET